MNKVSITKTDNNVYAALTKAIDDIGEKPITAGDRVLIKPNLVEPADPDSGEITTPGVVEAVARYCLDCGAGKVIIGEGPSYYQPESRMRTCFERSGTIGVAKRLGIEWVLFDEHRYRTFRGVRGVMPEEFRVTEFAFNCDKLINIPILKTHYLTKVTLAMKNLKGCLKREDKPRFHQWDLPRAVVELCKVVRPNLNIIDCTAKTIVRQLGVGYSDEKQRGAGLLITSTDIVAVDAVGSALMGIDPAEVRTVSLGAEAGLGEADLTQIDIVGEELKRLKFKVKLPQEELRENFPQLDISGAEKACSGCTIPLLASLKIIHERGMKPEKPLTICLGKKPHVPEDRTSLLVGDCTIEEGESKYEYVAGCPPNKEELVNRLAHIMRE